MGNRGVRAARIAFFDGYALTEGAGLALLDLIRRMDRERFEPMALMPRDGPLAEALTVAGCPVEVLPPGPPLNAYGRRLLVGGAAQKMRAGLALASYSVRLARWLRRRRINLLHCNQTRAAVLAGPAARLAGVPMLWNVRIHERMPPPIVRIAECCSSLIVPLTEDTFGDLETEQRLMSRARVIRNAIDLERFAARRDGQATREALGIPRDVPVILSAGALVPRKGFDVLIRAMPAVLEHHPQAHLLIAGGKAEGMDDCEAELQEMIAALDLSDAVTLAGRRSDMPRLFALSDLFALTSRCEGDPAVVLEAMACALPVIATPDAAAAVEDRVTGIVVPREYCAAAEAICELLARPDLSRRLGEAGRARVEQHHDLRAMVRAYEEAWASLLREGS